MNIVFGKNGQVASCLRMVLHKELHKWRFIGSDECNFENPKIVASFLENLGFIPEIIINASAFTEVDLAESQKEKAMNINANSVGEIAKFCEKNNTILVHYSTDYIFDGSGQTPFKVDDITNPINHYGATKLECERLILESKCKAYILRISWVYSSHGKNFVKTMLKLMQEKEEISVVCDQIGSPTSAFEVAKVTDALLKNQLEFPFGIYHFTDGGFCSWFEFACEIEKQARELGCNLAVKKINPIKTDQFLTLAKRPLNSRLETTQLSEYIKPWKGNLRRIIKNILLDF